jgi:threonine dehydrogenase-like Zn-dependent dehydrogenase
MSIPAGEMKAYRAIPGSKQLSLETVPIPTLGPIDVLLKVKAVGLAPGVFNMLRAGMLQSLPATLGHEIAGLVEATGPHVKNLAIGTRARIHSNVSCGTCKYCTAGEDQICVEAGIMGFQFFGQNGQNGRWEEYHDGGLAEYVRAPAHLIQLLPDNVNFHIGARVHEIATAYRTVRLANLPPAATVMVIAPTGAVGASIVKLAPLFSIKRLVLIGRSSERLKRVQTLAKVDCDIVAFDQLPEGWRESRGLGKVLRELQPEGGDAIIDLLGSGNDGFQAFGALAVGGSYVHLGGNMSSLPIPAVAFMVNCWTIKGTRNHSRAESELILRLLREGVIDMDELVTHRWKFNEVEEAVQRVHDRSLGSWFSVVDI